LADAVKRPYASRLRDEQARATRKAIVEAAAQLFITHGYGGTTIDHIAERAGVSRKTVFTSVGGKATALKLAIDWAIVGDDEAVPLLERPQVRAGMSEPDARRVLDEFAGSVSEVSARMAPLVAVAQAASGVDPEIRALVEDGRAQRLRGMRVLAQTLADRGALPRDLSTSEAADVLSLFNDPAVYQHLVVERQWGKERYRQWLKSTLTSLLIDDGYKARRAKTARGARKAEGGGPQDRKGGTSATTHVDHART
jgi:AcrR family transcriptional regulator